MDKITSGGFGGFKSSMKSSETGSRNYYFASVEQGTTVSEITWTGSGANRGSATTSWVRYQSQEDLRSTDANGAQHVYFNRSVLGRTDQNYSYSTSTIPQYTYQKQLPVTRLSTWEEYLYTYTTQTTTCEEARLTTTASQLGWTTSTSTTIGTATVISSDDVATTFSDIEWDPDATATASSPGSLGNGRYILVNDAVTAHAGLAELLVYASDKQRLNGKTFKSIAYTVTYSTRGYSIEALTGWGKEIIWGTTLGTIAVPLNSWDSTASVTSAELVTMVSVTSSSSLNTDYSGVFSDSAQGSQDEQDEYRIYQGATASASGRTIDVWRDSSYTVAPNDYYEEDGMGYGHGYPYPGGYAYVVATTQTGWVIPDQGFHTRAPASTLAETFPFFNVGQARPGVNLYPPLGAATPIYPTVVKTLFAGPPPLMRQGAEEFSEATMTLAFTQSVDQPPGFSVSPSVFQISRIEATSAETSTVRVQGQAGSYGGGEFSYIGGYGSDMPVTWTLVVGGPGVIVTYNTTSGTKLFTAPTSTTYAGSEGSYILYVPNLNGFERVFSIPLYHYDEF
jgi:hypothetical protein